MALFLTCLWAALPSNPPTGLDPITASTLTLFNQQSQIFVTSAISQQPARIVSTANSDIQQTATFWSGGACAQAVGGDLMFARCIRPDDTIGLYAFDLLAESVVSITTAGDFHDISLTPDASVLFATVVSPSSSTLLLLWGNATATPTLVLYQDLNTTTLYRVLATNQDIILYFHDIRIQDHSSIVSGCATIQDMVFASDQIYLVCSDATDQSWIKHCTVDPLLQELVCDDTVGPLPTTANWFWIFLGPPGVLWARSSLNQLATVQLDNTTGAFVDNNNNVAIQQMGSSAEGGSTDLVYTSPTLFLAGPLDSQDSVVAFTLDCSSAADHRYFSQQVLVLLVWLLLETCHIL